MMKRSKILYLILLVTILASCTTQKKTYKAPLKEEGTDYLFSKMQANESQFETFSAKGLVQVSKNGKRTDLKVNIRIKKDSAIWVSVSAGVGIEAARILLTRDSVLFLNRIDKSYFAGNYTFINHLINAQVDFDIIQALITGNDFKWYDYHDLKAKVVNDQYQLESTHRRKLKKYLKDPNCDSQVIYQSMWLNPISFKIERIKIKEIKNENKKIITDYSKFKNYDDQVIPTQYNISILAQDEILIDGTLLKVSLNEVIKFPFNIPSKYEEIQMK
ncbi:MAG: DUF4292 domain-containing protein [Bacteroidales bacterium]|nr:DUF4292 domain-containing protein [Bacteroidales bacterium]